MTADASRQAVVEARWCCWSGWACRRRTWPQPCTPLPTFAEYVPVVSAAVSQGTRRAYGSYWNRVVEHWGDRHLDEPTPSEIRQLMTYVKTHVVARRNARSGRSAEEHRCWSTLSRWYADVAITDSEASSDTICYGAQASGWEFDHVA